ncbi:MAG: amidohydrolase family protein [Vicinamibacterales bacterium]
MAATVALHGETAVYARPRKIADRFAIHAAVAFDGTGAPSLRDAVVLVENGRVVAFGTAPQIGELSGAYTVLEFPEHTVLPGLIDCHVHLMLVGDGRPIESIIDETNELLLLRSAQNAASHLAGGVTTIRELGARGRVTFDLREAVRAGLAPAPRLLLSGRPITPIGGHCHFFGGACEGTKAVRETARRLLQEGADVIKLMATGGLTRGTEHHVLGLDVEAMRVAVEEAHRAGRPTTVHASSIRGMRNALAAGVDCIEHAVFLNDSGTLTFDERLAEEVAEAGVFVSPTLQEAYRGVAALEEHPHALSVAEKAELVALRERKLGNIRNAARLHHAGVRLVAGSDAGSRVTLHGDLAFGVDLMTHADLSIAEAVYSATGLAAEACGIACNVGTLAPGKVADLLVVKGNVPADVRALANAQVVFQAGHVVAERVGRNGDAPAR